MKKLYLKKRYLNYILEGSKNLEGRVGYDNIKKLQAGDPILLNGEYKAYIDDIEQYNNFEEAVTEDNFKNLVPDASSREEAISTYEKFYPPEKQERLGVYVLSIFYPEAQECDFLTT